MFTFKHKNTTVDVISGGDLTGDDMDFTNYSYMYGKSSNANIAYMITPHITSCSNKIKGRTVKEALTYFKASLIEIVFHNPMMKAIGSKIMNVIPKILAIVTNICVIFFALLLADEHTDKA